MPVTAKLSRLFYERLGDEVANELVDLLNQVDTSYRAELREINDLNFARFEAKLEQRLAQLRGDLETALERGFKDQTRWMFVAWASLLIPIIGLWMRR